VKAHHGAPNGHLKRFLEYTRSATASARPKKYRFSRKNAPSYSATPLA
jgi:hypothetical protein